MEFNIADLFESVVDVAGDRDAVVAGEKRLTYGELDRRANRAAHCLAAAGIGPGDHVGLHLYNGIEFLEALLGLFKIRAVPINVNYRYVADELRYVFADADLKGLVHQREFTADVEAARDAAPELKVFIAVDDETDGDLSGLGSISYEEALASASPERDFGPRSPDDLYIVYTGGTTGMPKGVMWRHEDVFFAGLQGGNPGGDPISAPEELGQVAGSGDRAMSMLTAAPFIHGSAQWAAFISFFSGGKVVLIPGRSYDPDAMWRAVGQEQVTVINLVGDAMAAPLARALDRPDHGYDTSSLFVIASAGAVLSESIQKHLQQHLPTTMVLNNFGASETGHQGTVPPGTVSERPRFFMDETNCVLDDENRPVEPGSGVVGRLARTGHLPLGYYNDEAKTAQTFFEIDGKRWVVPGDMATIEADGMITVFGRGSVCINSGGEKIYPEEVEEAVKGHPGVADAIIVGVADDRWGQRVAAVVACRGDGSLTLDELKLHCRSVIAGYKVPRELHLVESVARQPSGKPDFQWAKKVADSGEYRV